MTLYGHNIQKTQTTEALRGAVKSQTVSLPWPPKELKPNARVHYLAKARAAKKYKSDCRWCCIEQRFKMMDEGELMLYIWFSAPNKRHFDLDNLLASIKPGIDAIAEAINVDDKHFSYMIRRSKHFVKHGRVDVTIRVVE